MKEIKLGKRRSWTVVTSNKVLSSWAGPALQSHPSLRQTGHTYSLHMTSYQTCASFARERAISLMRSFGPIPQEGLDWEESATVTLPFMHSQDMSGSVLEGISGKTIIAFTTQSMIESNFKKILNDC